MVPCVFRISLSNCPYTVHNPSSHFSEFYQNTDKETVSEMT
jgi:hypothetical protein